MKLIHCADLHLDSRMTSNLSGEKAKERKTEILGTFQRMIDYARQNGVRAILIAGDLFDTRNVSATARNIVKDAIVNHPEIDFLYLVGNHDNDNFLSKLEEIPANLKLFGENWKSYSYGNIVISGIEISAKNQSYLYNSLVLSNDVYNIVMLHGQLADYKSKDFAETISLNHLKNRNIDYLALGHIHSYRMEQLDKRGVYCYSGCLEGRGFDECGQKGFVVLDIDEKAKKANIQFVPAARRNLYTVQVDVSGVMTTQEAGKRMEQTLSELSYPSRSMIKFVLTGQVDVECEINCDFLQEMFLDCFYYVKVYNETTLLVNFYDYEKDESLKGEFVRMVLQSDLEEEKKSEVIRCGIMALSGEEL